MDTYLPMNLLISLNFTVFCTFYFIKSRKTSGCWLLFLSSTHPEVGVYQEMPF